VNAGLDSGPMVDLSGRVALVTGAAGPAGRAIAAAVAAAGARVALVGSTLERVEAVAHELGLDRDGWLAVGADLRDAAQARDAVDAVVERFGRVDVLAHLVGGWMGGVPASETPDDAFRSMLDQHLWTTVNVARIVVPVMVEAGFGRIVAVSSPVVAETPARTAAYTVGKAAEEALLGALARETAATGVTVNVLRVRTVDAEGLRDREPGPKTASWTTPDEIAAAVLYLCSPAAGAVTGARIPLHRS
jgi:NAD(P)-dependent dehydrogenase (short-subunit alcohol dehydrogenase family)